MKFGHPRVYNPWQSEEYQNLTAIANEMTEYMNVLLDRLHRKGLEQRIVFAQIRDCMLTRDEQIARLDALDEVGAPQ